MKTSLRKFQSLFITITEGENMKLFRIAGKFSVDANTLQRIKKVCFKGYEPLELLSKGLELAESEIKQGQDQEREENNERK